MYAEINKGKSVRTALQRCSSGILLLPEQYHQQEIPDESTHLDILSFYDLNYVIPGPAGHSAVDLGFVMDEFDNFGAKLGRAVRPSEDDGIDWGSYNVQAVSFAVHFADSLEGIGKSAMPYFILHPGFSDRGPAGSETVFVSIARTLKTVDSSKIVFETVPGWHARFLDGEVIGQKEYGGLDVLQKMCSIYRDLFRKEETLFQASVLI